MIIGPCPRCQGNLLLISQCRENFRNGRWEIVGYYNFNECDSCSYCENDAGFNFIIDEWLISSKFTRTLLLNCTNEDSLFFDFLIKPNCTFEQLKLYMTFS